jgi:RNA polymerase sigma factor (sigma-70 family)
LRQDAALAVLQNRQAKWGVADAMPTYMPMRLGRKAYASGMRPTFGPLPRSLAARAVDVDAQIDVKDLLALLPPREAELLRLRYMHGCEQQEVARMWNRNKAVVCRLEKRALRRLRERM